MHLIKAGTKKKTCLNFTAILSLRHFLELSLRWAILNLLHGSAMKKKNIYFTHNFINLIIESETDDKVEIQV